MTRLPTARPRTRRGSATVGVLVALAVAATAAAPSVITIQPGDTLWELARTHGTSVAELRALNDLPGHGTIYAGDQLRLPGGSAAASGGAASGAGEVSHLVRRGDTLSQIALRYGVSQQAIAQRNGLTDGRIYAGTTIAVPGARGSAGAASTPSSGTARSVPGSVSRSVAENRRILAARSHPSRDQVRAMIAATAERYDVPPSLALAVAFQESGFQQQVVSGVNAIGIMQVLPRTARVLGQQNDRTFDLLDPQDNITAGVLLLRQLLRSEGTADKALAGYYQGLGSIARQGVLPQTYAYIDNVNALRARFANG